MAVARTNEASAFSTVRSPMPSLSAQEGIRPLPSDGSSFYYYVNAVRVQLTPSLEWISVQFVSPDPTVQAAALRDSIAGPPGRLRRNPDPQLTLVPLDPGLTVDQLISGINVLRSRPADFVLVNPVFETGNSLMIVTDEFIASFPAEKGKEEIGQINLSNGVEIVEPVIGQYNTFVLKVTPRTHLDALAMANLYQETHTAVSAAPNFLRLMEN